MRAAWILFTAGCGFQVTAVPGEGTASLAPDAAFDFASCPSTYNVTSMPGPSRYRLITAGGAPKAQSDVCNLDMPGATHLVVFDTLVELNAAGALVDSTTLAASAIWIGGVQQPAATRPGDLWLGFDDLPLMDQWYDNEPNDGGGKEDHGEQFVVIIRDRHFFTDVPSNFGAGALCECDGKPVGPMALAAIAANR
ncbi:MAG TPA: hypothetical protein VFT22_25565 [Kofleriaceae bacterium]|nr:hypothetical protein [Kofleriaceae bacterium]